MTNITKKDRIQGALVGLLVGDALGVPYEFHPADRLPPIEQLEYEPPAGFNRAHKQTPIGTWSDDGALALCLLASLLHCQTFDATDFANRIRNWQKVGYMAVDGRVFDIGVTTGIALQNLNSGVSPLLAGIETERSNGNGSLMRVMPLVLWHEGSDKELITFAQQQSCVTHAHLRSQLCCALYCLWAKNLLNQIPNPWLTAVKTLQDFYQDDEPHTKEIEWHIRPLESYQINGSGYVVDSLHSAKHCLANHQNFEQCVKAAVALGNDTDTTACITGGVAGLIYGIQGIPKRWITHLRGQDILQPLLDDLLAHS